MEEIRVGSAVSTAAGVSTGELRTGDMPDGAPITIPVVILRGETDGPTLWLNGCVHGDELCGTYIIHEVLRTVAPGDLTGTIVAMPLLNVTASQKVQRMSPFELFGNGDLNRCFPGDPGGLTTQQMAHHIYGPLKQYADFLIDFHTALTIDVRWALYADAPGEVGRKAAGIAKAFGYKSTLPAPIDILGGSAMMTAARDGIPSFIVEAGGMGAAFDRAVVEDAAERLRNVMRHLGMLQGAVTDYGAQYGFSNFAWVNSTRGGLFENYVKCGDRLEVGTKLGRYFDVFGDVVEEPESPCAGIVLAINNGPVMPTGVVLVHIGLDPQNV
ncbi:MAG: succinylglutamate desuccinylase/aspartoacylase family protein [Hyphomicrobiales bacterium]|nr:succinylglutamate desuccinylase/aspartoacylase family protein [Hyphomicrobiales bacterium]MCP5374183.1 succinylglutamate desuccinylase/aspartoacylase family protein [Hyphomicrobiales bacterium]